MNPHCALCGGPLSVRWDPSDPMVCRSCGASNRTLHLIEGRAEDSRYALHVEDEIARDGE